MRKPALILLSVMVSLIITLACGLPVIPVTGPNSNTLDPNVVNTAIMGTMQAALTQTAGAVPVGLAESPVPSATWTPSLTATALPTNTSSVPLITVSVDTNCRTGPGKVYDRVGALMVGEVSEVAGHDATWSYWYIKNPDNPGSFCWLWGKYANLSGNLVAIPLLTPPPTPTPLPSFEVHAVGMDHCTGYWVELRLTNTGVVTFSSISLTIKDTGEGDTVSMAADKFTNLDGCLDSTSVETLEPGKTYRISTPPFPYNIKGHVMRASVTLCTADAQKGDCVSTAIKFKP